MGDGRYEMRDKRREIKDTRYKQKIRDTSKTLTQISHLISHICLFLSSICLFCVLQGYASAFAQEVKSITRVLDRENEVVFYDERYLPADYVENPEQIVSFLEEKGFYHLEADQLKDWMNVKISKGALGSVCVMTMGFVPDTVAETMDRNCTIYKYLEAGGKIVWIGNVPFWYQGHMVKKPDNWGAKGLEAILEIEAIEEDHFGDRIEITEEGRKRGMEVIDNAKFPVAMKDVTIALSQTLPQKKTITRNTLVPSEVEGSSITHNTSHITQPKSMASSWFKNINSRYPESGFIRYRATWYDGARNDLNEDLYYLAVYPGIIRTSMGVEGTDEIEETEE